MTTNMLIVGATGTVGSELVAQLLAPLANAGVYAPSDDVVQRILGRRASTFRDWIERHREAFRNSAGPTAS